MGVSPMILAYDCENNLHCVSNAVNGTASLYWYDSAGRRIAKSENNLLTLYIWDGMDIIATVDAAGEITAYFTRGIGIAGDVGSLIAETRFSGGTATTTYLHSNWRGDVVMATDASGAVVGEYSYTTFGEQLSVTGTYTPRFTFSSKECDASGLVYYGFRYYSPVLCRWISEDPIREAGGINLYQFCGNNPVNRIDRDGKIAPNVVAGLIGGAVGGTVGIVVGGIQNGWSGAARGFLTGAAGGFVTGFTFGMATPFVTGAGTGIALGAATGALGGAASGITGEVIDWIARKPCDDGKWNWKNVGTSMAWGAVGGGAIGGIGGWAGGVIDDVTGTLMSVDIEIISGYTLPETFKK